MTVGLGLFFSETFVFPSEENSLGEIARSSPAATPWPLALSTPFEEESSTDEHR